VSRARTIRRRARAAAVIERFERLWPKCFALCAARRRPLKIGIDKDLIEICRSAIAKGIVTVADIKGTLRRYTGSDGYLRKMRAGAGRLDFDGKVVATVTAVEAKHASQILAERQKKGAVKQSGVMPDDITAVTATASRTQKESHGAPASASVAKQNGLRHERYSTS
jgi:sRNA-binding protein